MRMTILIAAGLIATASFSAAEPLALGKDEALANRVVELLSKQDSRSVARLMHYPPSYSENRRQEDMAEVEKSLRFLLGEFGTPSDIKREKRPVAFFELSGGGGDVPYWQSLSPFETFDFIYVARFSNLDAGLIKVRIFHHPNVGTPEIQSVGFGLSVTRADAKSEMISMIKKMMRLKGSPLPPNIDEILEQSIKPEEPRI